MSIKIYFGIPGSGKTTLAAKLVHDNLKQGIKTYSNVPIKGAILFDASEIGVYDISDGDMVLDEAGIQFNNRKFKELKQSTIEWFKLSRHYGIKNIHVFSQSYDDMDITLRRLADEIYVVKRSILPYLFSIRRIKVKVGIDKETHQIVDQYFFQFLGVRPYLGYHFWHMFDSWSAPDLSLKDWYFSSYPDYTIDKKHCKIIYKEVHKQGKVKYKVWQLLKRTFNRKNITEKSARIKHILMFVSQMIKSHVRGLTESKRSKGASGGTKEPKIIDPDDTEAFKQFFLQPPRQEENSVLKKIKTQSFVQERKQKKNKAAE